MAQQLEVAVKTTVNITKKSRFLVVLASSSIRTFSVLIHDYCSYHQNWHLSDLKHGGGF